EDIPWESVSLEKKVDYARTINKKNINAEKTIVDAITLLQHYKTYSLFVNRNRCLEQLIPRTEYICMVIMQDGRKSSSLHIGKSKQGGYENINISDKDREEMITDCKRLLYADRIEPGTYDVIFDPEFSGIFAHEAFGHGTETDQFLKKRSKGEEYLGKKVASELVNMYDSPVVENASASFIFDDEGFLASETEIIKNGILQRGITDGYSGYKLNLKRTANGRRQSYANKAYSRMTNTYFGLGSNTLEEMLASIESGYLLRHPSNGMEDPKGWGIQLEGYYVEEIKEGKLTGKVFSPVIVTGYVPDLLESISMVGDEIAISGLGFCGKGHKEWVKVTDGGPYLKLEYSNIYE
ncbi:MAG: TldD/PmbA family protein, partial [Nitrospinae bacterium]|nr:TldD/PmbA family protein [Nitrospinota bacterium]